MRITCRGVLHGKPCRNTLIEIEGAEFRVKHRGRTVVLRGAIVSGCVRCEDCGHRNYLLPADLGVVDLTAMPDAA